MLTTSTMMQPTPCSLVKHWAPPKCVDAARTGRVHIISQIKRSLHGPPYTYTDSLRRWTFQLQAHTCRDHNVVLFDRHSMNNCPLFRSTWHPIHTHRKPYQQKTAKWKHNCIRSAKSLHRGRERKWHLDKNILEVATKYFPAVLDS